MQKESPSVSQDEDGIALTLSLLDETTAATPTPKAAEPETTSAAMKNLGPVPGGDLEAAVVTSDLSSVISL
jgi:hypothetical protein